MNARRGVAVATSVKLDILIADEVLAVGGEAF
jgi:ABC-type polysaccharide/polyol phosphate transport system ATPase subunit